MSQFEVLGSGEKAMLFLHGILGRGQNFRSLARAFAEGNPTWRAVLVDVRFHGASAESGPPYTLEACVDELLALGIPGLAGAVGHSFGGKLALALAQRTALSHLAILDSSPSPRPSRRGSEVIEKVIQTLRKVTGQSDSDNTRAVRFSSRRAFADALLEHGVARMIAEWLATSLQAEGDAFVYPVHLDAIEGLLEDYFARDAWAGTLAVPHLLFLVGGRSAIVDAEDLERLAALGHCKTVVLPQAGHWVHVEAAAEVLEQIQEFTKNS